MCVKSKQIYQNLFMSPSVVCIVTYYGKIKNYAIQICDQCLTPHRAHTFSSDNLYLQIQGQW